MTKLMQIYNATLNTLRGLSVGVKAERAFRQEVILLLLALPAGVFLAPNLAWYVAMIGSILVCMSAELLNTAIEKLADRVSLERDPRIGLVKDFGSAAVFCVLCCAGLIWCAALATKFSLI